MDLSCVFRGFAVLCCSSNSPVLVDGWHAHAMHTKQGLSSVLEHLQFYVEALVDAFHALKLAVGPGTPLLKDCMQTQRLQDIVTFLVTHHIHHRGMHIDSGSLWQ
jgi:uncharacterized damage-inducible protein DinB